jgi:hypothetical protein
VARPDVRVLVVAVDRHGKSVPVGVTAFRDAFAADAQLAIGTVPALAPVRAPFDRGILTTAPKVASATGHDAREA